MKLEVGMYCYHRIERWKGIGKIIKIDGDNICVRFKSELVVYTKKNVVGSDKPIDLIEVGDYVNGCFVDEILNSDECYDDRTHFHLLKFNSYFTNKDIQSIVTKEQFSQMEYKID